MTNKFNLKLLFIPVGFVLIIFLIILSVPMGNNNKDKKNTIPLPTSFPTGIKPSPLITKVPTSGPSPTLIPLKFTGGDLTQDIPPDVKLFSQQKTELRRKTPLELSFGAISFNYESDKFEIIFTEPKDQSQAAFETWLLQTYPALTEKEFVLN